MKYKASLDAMAKVVTGLCIVIFLFGVVYTAKDALSPTNTSDNMAAAIIIAVVLPAILIGCWLFSVQYYLVERGFLCIKRPAGVKRIPINDIKVIRRIGNEELKSTIRTFGVGGLFGYYGKFFIPTLGTVTFYATSSRNLLLITTESGKMYAISPDNENLIGELEREAMHSE